MKRSESNIKNSHKPYISLAVAFLVIIFLSSSAKALEGNETVIVLPNTIDDPVSLTFQGIEFIDYLDTYKMTFDNGDVIDSTASGNEFSKSSNELIISDIFTNVHMNYNAEGRSLKQEIILDAKPYSSIKSEYVYFTSEIDFDHSYFLYANGQRQDGDFETKGTISIADKTMARITIERPFAIDSKGNRIDLSYLVKHTSILGFFEHWYLSVKIPVSYLESAAYPVTIDPTAISGCSESATEILCSGGTFSGNYIDTTKNITITGATINGINLDGGLQGLVRLNSTGGNVSIISSTINAYGGSQSNDVGYAGNFLVQGAPAGLYIISSTVNAYGGSASCPPGTGLQGGTGSIDLSAVTGNITYDGAILNSYGGDGCGVGAGSTGNGNAGSYLSDTNKSLVATGSGVRINAYGGAGVIGGSSGSPSAIGGQGSCAFYDRNILTLGSANITANCYGGSTSGSVGTKQGGDGVLTFSTVDLLNATFFVNFNAGGSVTGGSRLDASSNSNSSRFIFRNSNLAGSGTGGSIGGYARWVASELTIINASGWTTEAATLNASQDILRYATFSSSQPAITINYNQSFGAIVINTSSPGTITTTSGINIVYRNLSDYYFPLHKLSSPSNNTLKLPGVIPFNVTYVSEYYTPANLTYFVWFANGTLFNQTTVTTNGQRNTSSLNINLSQNGNYLWNARLTSTSNLQQWWYGNGNFTLLLGATLNNETYNASTYQTARESFLLNITTGVTNVTSASLVYNGTSYAGTVSIAPTETIITRSIDIPAVTGSIPFYWNLIFGDGSNQQTSTNNQNVAAINLSICGSAPQNIPYINFTFADEVSLSALNGSIASSNWVYYLGNGTVNKSLSYSNVGYLPSYAFCFSPQNKTVNVAISSLRYAASGYPERTYLSSGTALTNSTTNTVLYLLSSSTGIYSSILVVQGLGTTPVIGATVLVEITYDGGVTYTTVGLQQTDSSGTATFFLNPGTQYRYTVSATGFDTQIFFLTPSQTVYTVRLSGSGSTTNPYNSSLAGYKWFVTPQPGSLDAGVNTFVLNLTAFSTNLYSCRFSILNESNLVTLNSTTGGTSAGCYLTITYNLTDNQNVFGKLEINNSATNGEYQIVDTDWKWVSMTDVISTWTTLKSFFESLNNLSDFGGTSNRQEFSKIMFFFLITTILLAVFTFISGFELQNPGVAVLLLWFIVFMASVGGIFDFSAASDNINDWIKKYGVLIIYSMFSIGYILNQMRKQS